MLEKRKKIEIILAILLLLVLVIVLALLFFKPGDGNNQNDDGGEDITVVEPIVETTVSSRTLESPPDIIARSFVERFGSYSTDIDYENVDDVKAFATAGLITQLDTLLNDVRTSPVATYYGVSTKVITIDMMEESADSARFAITTQRKETVDTPANTSVRYQDIEVLVTKAGNRWLVDDFTWGE